MLIYGAGSTNENEIGVAQGSVNVTDNLQAGTDQKIDVKPDTSQGSTPA